jgi:regulatory protein YycH of two-component signal transduction system YycFG
MSSTGDRVVVGASSDERSGGQNSEGLAYMFVSGSGGWTQQSILSGSLAIQSADNFGYSVAINSTGDRVVVGAYGDERISGSSSSGLAYVFVSGAGGWTEQHILSGSLATDTSDQFGNCVAMNSAGDRIIVGAYFDERIGGLGASGLAYMFVSGTGGWTQQHILSGSLAVNTSDFFGYSVAMNSAGDRVIVGARQDGGVAEGLVYIFVSGTGGWTQQPILSGTLANNSNDRFGHCVAMNSTGDRVIVGAPQDERGGGTDAQGLAYIFVSGTGGWTQQPILSGSLATDGSDNFGYSVAINSTGDRVIVGAWQDETSGALGASGLAYMFVSGTGGWTQQHILSGSLAIQSFDNFGHSVAMSSTGDRVVVGASSDERSGGLGDQGLAYVFNEE